MSIKKVIDRDQVRILASFGLTINEIAAAVDCSTDVLDRRFASTIRIGKNQGLGSIRRKQFEVAMSGNVPMLIHLGKHKLGQVDNLTLSGDKNAPLEIIVKYIDEPNQSSDGLGSPVYIDKNDYNEG